MNEISNCPQCGNGLDGKGECSICSYRKEIKWVRLKHVSSALCLTCSAGETLVTREVFWKAFRNLRSPSGNNAVDYFPSEVAKAFFTIVRKDEICWEMKAVAHRNSILLNEKKVDAEFVPLAHGDIIKIHSGKEDAIVAEFMLELGVE